MQHTNFETQVKIAVLWIYGAAMMTAQTALYYMQPGVIEKMYTGEMWMGFDAAPWLLFMSLFWFIPQIMSVLSLFLENTSNRKVNLIASVIFGILIAGSFIEHLVEHVSGAALEPPYLYNLLMVGSIVLTSFLISYKSFKWDITE